ncbi:hypothetical protein L596_025723 [Steinernema carpocapsae]|uniref:Hexosyltransferase n=1 Tax=Steinernema carpocapsae TaxID=34508 RepID=A0A4U5M9I6_STECR|nr:hypothetical protein L596_025723 [Steinernema carpocapsae]
MPEAYYSLSLKTYAIFRYHSEFCSQARCILKADSDVVVNVAGVEQLCKAQNATPHVTGTCHNYRTNVARSSDSKFYLPKFIFAVDKYPAYCWGAAYMYSGQNISDLILSATSKSPFLKSENFRRLPEDVTFTGLVRILANVSLEFNSGFAINRGGFHYWCLEKSSPVPLTAHFRIAKNPVKNWDRMKKELNGSTSFWSYDRWRKCRFQGTGYFHLAQDEYDMEEKP